MSILDIEMNPTFTVWTEHGQQDNSLEKNMC